MRSSRPDAEDSTPTVPGASDGEPGAAVDAREPPVRALRALAWPAATLAGILVPALLFLFQARIDHARALADAHAAVALRVDGLQAQVDRVLGDGEQVLVRVADHFRGVESSALAADDPANRAFLASSIENVGGVLELSLIGADGNLLLDAHGVSLARDGQATTREFFVRAQTAMHERVTAAGPLKRASADGEPVIGLVLPRSRADGAFDGLWLMELRLRFIAELWSAAPPMFPGSEQSALVDATGTPFVVVPPPGEGATPRRLPRPVPGALLASGVESKTEWIETPSGRQRAWVASKRLTRHPLHVVHAVERSGVLAGVYRRFALYGVLAALTALIVVALTQRIRRDNRRLVDVSPGAVEDDEGTRDAERRVDDANSSRDAAVRALHAAETRLARLVAAGVFGAGYVDSEGRLTEANEYFLRTLSLDDARIRSGKIRVRELTPPEWAKNDADAFAEMVASGYSVPYEKEMVRDDGARVPVVAGLVALDPDQRRRGYLLYFADLTDRRLAEQALREADRRRDEFVSVLAHELRNPLAPIANAVSILGRPDVGPDTRERILAIARRQVAQLTRLVDDLLEVSRISRGAVTLNGEPVRLVEPVSEAIEASASFIEDRHQRLDIDVDEDVAVEGDRARLAQAFANLLANASKFTPGGGRIGIEARREADEAVVVVRDNGTGIAAEDIDKLFDPFWLVEQSAARAVGELGLGLALVKRIVELHGGSVSARSEGRDRGSVFTLRLPLVVPPLVGPPAPATRPAPSAEAERCRVLVADDNRDAADSLAALLTAYGHEVRVAYDGEHALEVAGAWLPDVALLDIGMPWLDGYEVARRIRAAPWGRDARLVAVTGWGQPTDVERALQAGFDDHVTKPADPVQLKEVIAIAKRPR